MDVREMIDGALSLNASTGFYEGTVTVQVDPELFKRVLITALEEDECADLTNPQTWGSIMARIGKVAYWLDRPHTKVTTPLRNEYHQQPPQLQQRQIEQPKKPAGAAATTTMATAVKPMKVPGKTVLKARLIGEVKSLPPHRWEEILTPLGNLSMIPEERYVINHTRHTERQILKELRQEWMDGAFVLEKSAEEEEREHQMREEKELVTTLEAVSGAVNGNRLH